MDVVKLVVGQQSVVPRDAVVQVRRPGGVWRHRTVPPDGYPARPATRTAGRSGTISRTGTTSGSGVTGRASTNGRSGVTGRASTTGPSGATGRADAIGLTGGAGPVGIATLTSTARTAGAPGLRLRWAGAARPGMRTFSHDRFRYPTVPVGRTFPVYPRCRRG